MFLENSPDPINAAVYDAPDASDKNFLSCGVRPKSAVNFVDFAGKPGLIGILLISCILQLLYFVNCSEAETFKYIKIGENETSTRIVKAAKLRYIKIGEHENYTRVVFEFKEPVRHDTPVIGPGGKFAVVFFDTTTALSSRIMVDATERVERIEFEQRESNLKADVSMSFPRFRIKSFSLAEPDRLVIDVFRLENPVDIVPGNIVLQKMVFKDSKYSPVEEEKVIHETVKPENIADKDNVESVRAESPLAEESPAFADIMADTADETGNFAVREVQRKYDPVPIVHIDQEDDTAAGYQKDPDFIINHMAKKDGGNGNLQVYLLPLLTALSVTIILLLVFIVFQKKKSAGLPGSAKRLESLKANDETIAAINAKINREIKKIKQA